MTRDIPSQDGKIKPFIYSDTICGTINQDKLDKDTKILMFHYGYSKFVATRRYIISFDFPSLVFFTIFLDMSKKPFNTEFIVCTTKYKEKGIAMKKYSTSFDSGIIKGKML